MALKQKRTSAVVHAMLPYAIRPAWLFVRFTRLIKRLSGHKPTARNVLLVCQNCVAADHLQPIISLLRGDQNLKQYVTNDHFPSQEISKSQIKKSIALPYRNVLRALLSDWDLIIYVNHPWGFGAWFAPFIKKIYINHGLYTGKINNAYGEDGVYGKTRTFRPHRGLMFDKMFVASTSERNAALAANPDLKGRLEIVGSLMVDEIRERRKQRALLRKRLGVQEHQKLIHIISTWGATSLIATVGDSLLEVFTGFDASYKFVLSLHPRFDKFGGFTRTRDDVLSQWSAMGVIVDRDNSHWKDILIASDMAIADNSSLAFYYFILKKVVRFVVVDKDASIPGSPFDVLRKGSNPLTAANIKASITQSSEPHFSKSSVIDANYLVEFLGTAYLRHEEEIQKLLNS